jgi:hypothetical protein
LQVGEITEPAQASFPQKPIDALVWPSEGRELCGTGVVEIDAALDRLERRIPIPVENKMGCPKLGEIGGKVEQAKQVVSGSELNPSALQSYEKVGHVVGAAGKFSPLLLAAAVHIQEPVAGKGRLCSPKRMI